MAMFNSYVSLPEGNQNLFAQTLAGCAGCAQNLSWNWAMDYLELLCG